MVLALALRFFSQIRKLLRDHLLDRIRSFPQLHEYEHGIGKAMSEMSEMSDMSEMTEILSSKRSLRNSLILEKNTPG